eukprot:12933583-Prorocentrum_lima.AAC.1
MDGGDKDHQRRKHQPSESRSSKQSAVQRSRSRDVPRDCVVDYSQKNANARIQHDEISGRIPHQLSVYLDSPRSRLHHLNSVGKLANDVARIIEEEGLHQQLAEMYPRLDSLYFLPPGTTHRYREEVDPTIEEVATQLSSNKTRKREAVTSSSDEGWVEDLRMQFDESFAPF